MTNQSGRTMLEMLGVLGIMGIITYGAIAGINYGMSSYKINQTYSEVQDIIQGVEDLYSWSKGYPSDREKLMAAACNNDVFTNSSSCTEGGSAIVQGAFGDMWLEGNGTCSDATCSNFKIVVPITNPTECTRLAQMDWKANSIECVRSGTTECSCNSEGPTNLEFSPL